MPVVYIYLVLSILTETIGTTALQASQQFTRLWPSLTVVVFYGTSIYLLSKTLTMMPVGVVYAVWSGLGIVLISMIGFVIFGQRLDAPAMLGIGMILAGILIIHLFSATSPH